MCLENISMEESLETTCDLCMEKSTQKHYQCSTKACNHPICIECCMEYCNQKVDFDVDCPFCKASKIVFSEEDVGKLQIMLTEKSDERASNIFIYMMSVMIAVYKKNKYSKDFDSQQLEELLTKKERNVILQFHPLLLLKAIQDIVIDNGRIFKFSEAEECTIFFKDVNEYISNQLR